MSRFEATKIFAKTFILVFVVGFGLYKYLEYAYSPVGTSLAHAILFTQKGLASAGGKYDVQVPTTAVVPAQKPAASPTYNGPAHFPFTAGKYVKMATSANAE